MRAANLFYGIGSGKTLELKQATVSHAILHDARDANLFPFVNSLPDFIPENQLNTFVYLKFLICPPCCHDGTKLEKIRHITKLHPIKRLLQVTKLDILIHSAFHQWRIREVHVPDPFL